MRTLAVLSALLFVALPVFADAPGALTLTVPDVISEDVSSMDWSVAAPAVRPENGADDEAGPGVLVVTKPVSNSSKFLFANCAKGNHLREGKITARKAGKGQQEFLIIVMHDIVITSVKTTGKGDAPVETISLSYGSVKVTYTSQD